jgi:5-carboxymethyl-2-hydroxymuconate isomerase
MPHLSLEYSANLRDDGNIGALMPKLANTLLSIQAEGKPVYPVGGVRVRAYAAEDWCIGHGLADAAFVHATLRVGKGRSAQTLAATGDALLEVLKHHFAVQFERHGLAISLYLDEVDETTSWKHNNLHLRLAGPR